MCMCKLQSQRKLSVFCLQNGASFGKSQLLNRANFGKSKQKQTSEKNSLMNFCDKMNTYQGGTISPVQQSK